jgi:hypothetical protein
MHYGEVMKITRSQLRRLITESVINEGKSVEEKMQALVDEAPEKRAIGKANIKDYYGDIGQAKTSATNDARSKLGSGSSRPIAKEVSSDGIIYVVVEKQ